ncbi:hypothetical protein EGW08_000978 [Elysia chlorotica]|uniref:Uncharacterized protein n=1 Tax=Elysia chlorotica TaxID=188477 RepID=A0A433UBT9_ELYCH|nr:hypothetical protein EGW08_000978 [Elysia chlorotica]
MTKVLLLLAVCLLQFPAANATGVDGQIILGIFIPLSLLVMAYGIGRACWTWYLTHGLGEWAYDPYLDVSLRSKYPTHVEPPFSRGHVVHSFGPLWFNDVRGSQVLGMCPNTLSETSGKPISTLSRATHKIGSAMIHNQSPDKVTGESILSEQTMGEQESDTQAHTDDITPIPEISLGLNGTFETQVTDSILVPKHSSPQGSKPFLPLFSQSFSSPEPASVIESPPEKVKRPMNPYGVPNNTSDTTFSETSDQDTIQCSPHSSNATNATHSLITYRQRGHKPRFSAFVRIKWAESKERIYRLRTRARSAEPTSRDLQRDVKTNEDRMLYSIAALRNQLVSSYISQYGNTEQSFELGPVAVPLRQMRSSMDTPSHIALRIPNFYSDKRRMELGTRPSRKRRWKLKFFSSNVGVHDNRSAFKASRETLFGSSATTTADRISLGRRAKKDSRNENNVRTQISASNYTLNNDENFKENYTAMFDNLFEKANKRV